MPAQRPSSISWMAAARRFAVEDSARIEQNWWKNCSVLLAERVAKMVTRCSPTIRMPPVLGGAVDADDGVGGTAQGHEADLSAVVVTDMPGSDGQ